MSRLGEIEVDPSHRAHLAEIADRIFLASNYAELQALLHVATVALGAERSFFASVRGEGRDSSYAIVLDCDPSWWHAYRSACPLENNPWLDYAKRHSTAVRASELGSMAGLPHHGMHAESTAAFGSAALIPAHSGQLDNRVSLLCLGHSVPGHFEDPTFASLLVSARSVAMELHDWWSTYERHQLSQRTHLTEADLDLLKRHCAGLCSKKIAQELQVSHQSINSRFQRIVTKLGVRNRRAAARVAIECGLING